jgi:hypothetical protein
VAESLVDRAILLGCLIGVAVGLGIALILFERPPRLGRLTRTRRWSVVALATVLVAIVVSAETQGQPAVSVAPPTLAPVKGVPLATVVRDVKASDTIKTVPPTLIPPLSQVEATSNFGIPALSTGCSPDTAQSTVPACVFGDRNGSHTMVLYGDSHAGMWFDALDDIATSAHWRLILLWKAACPAAPLPTQAPGGRGEWIACDQWHRFALARINRIDPDLLIVSQSPYDDNATGARHTPAQWRTGLKDLLRSITAPKTVKLVLGDIPSSLGPDCLTRSPTNVQACSLPLVSFLTPYDEAERRAAADEKTRYVDVKPWFCVKRCSAIIGSYSAYYLSNHVAVGYSRFLEGVLAQSLDLSRFGR